MVTGRIVDHIKEWQARPLDSLYFVCWMDGIQFKIRHNGKVISKCIYLIIGLKSDCKKEVLGMWINETESASFWLDVLIDLKALVVTIARGARGEPVQPVVSVGVALQMLTTSFIPDRQAQDRLAYYFAFCCLIARYAADIVKVVGHIKFKYLSS